MKLYSFMQDRHWYEDIGLIFIGLVPMWGWIREHWQWPPGDTGYYDLTDRRMYQTQKEDGDRVPYAPHDRVADSYRDFLGYAIGGTIRTAVLVGLLIWKWLV